MLSDKKREKAAARSQKRRDRDAERGIKNVPFKIHVGERARIDMLKTAAGLQDRTEYLVSLVLADEARHLRTLTPAERDAWENNIIQQRDASQNGEKQ